MNRGPQNRPKYIMVLTIGATKMLPLNFGNSHVGLYNQSQVPASSKGGAAKSPGQSWRAPASDPKIDVDIEIYRY